jgi:hypothetical protein
VPDLERRCFRFPPPHSPAENLIHPPLASFAGEAGVDEVGEDFVKEAGGEDVAGPVGVGGESAGELRGGEFDAEPSAGAAALAQSVRIFATMLSASSRISLRLPMASRARPAARR